MRNNIYNINFGESSQKSQTKNSKFGLNLIGYWAELATWLFQINLDLFILIFQTNKEKG